MQRTQEKVEVKCGDYQNGFTTLHAGDSEAEAVKKAKATKKLDRQIVLVTHGDHIVFCRY